MDKFYEVVLIVPYIHEKTDLLHGFLINIRNEYTPSVLRSVNLYSWSASDTLGITLSFDDSSFLPRHLDTLETWAEKAGAKFYNLMLLGEKEREIFKSKLPLTSDLKFTGDFDIPSALNNIFARTNTTVGRKSPRYIVSIRVTFKSEEQFIQEYTKDISNGGIFVATDKPLPMESKVELVLSLPNFPKVVKVIGEIVHIFNIEQVKLLDHNRVPGMGVQFLEFEEDGQQVLEEYFKSLSKEHQSSD